MILSNDDDDDNDDHDDDDGGGGDDDDDDAEEKQEEEARRSKMTNTPRKKQASVSAVSVKIQRKFQRLGQCSIATLLQHCFEWLQHCQDSNAVLR